MIRWLENWLCMTDLPAMPPGPGPKNIPRADLGPKQLAWCAEKLMFEGKPVFRDAKLAVQAVEAEVAANRAAMKGEYP